MKKQFVVIGVDRFGASVARTLQKNGIRVIAVDHDSEKIQQIASDVSYAVTADVEDPDIIATLDLRNVDGAVICIVDHMQASIVAAIVCQEMGITNITARASSEIHGRILERLGVTRIVYPEKDMGERVGRYLSTPEFVDWVALSPDYSMVELMVQPEWIGKSLAQLCLRQSSGLNVVGCKIGSEVKMNLNPDEPLAADTVLYVIGSNESLSRFR